LPAGTIALPATISVHADGRGALALICTGSAPTCSGEVVLLVKHVTGSGRHRRTRLTPIGAVKFTIASGRKTNVEVRLSPLGRRLLHAAGGRLAASLTLRRAAPAAAPTTSAATRLVLARDH
jgi:hypothetical protein